MIGWWSGFPYWTTAAVTAVGGILGVMFSVPLRRALVVDTPLPYPEGVAAAEVLKCGAGSREGDEENAKGLRLIIVSALTAAAFTLRRQDPAARRGGRAILPRRHGLDRHIRRPLLCPGRRRPPRRHLGRHGDAARPRHRLVDPAADPHQRPRRAGRGSRDSTVFRQDVRFFGAGVIGVAAVWTLLRIIGPILKRHPLGDGRLEAARPGRRGAAAGRARHPDRHRRRGHPRLAAARSRCCCGCSSPAARSPAARCR